MKLLLIEDEPSLAADIQAYLQSQHFVCEWVKRKEEALEKISIYEYDCILLDLHLPDGDGFDILKSLKDQNKTDGVIITSAKESLDTKLEGFQLGADDYITKPFHLPELTARIQALVRRKAGKEGNVLISGDIAVNVFTKTVAVKNNPLELTRKEFDLLLYFLGNENRVLSKSAIAEHLSGDMADLFDNHDFVYAHIKNLKRKLASAGCEDCIQSVYGLGYKWKNG